MNLSDSIIIFTCSSDFGAKIGRFYGSICWKFTKVSDLSAGVTKQLRWLFRNAKVHKITIFMARHIVWLFHDGIENGCCQVIAICIRWIVFFSFLFRCFSLFFLTITTAMTIKIAYEVSSRAGTAISFANSFSRDFIDIHREWERESDFFPKLFVLRIQNIRAKYKHSRGNYKRAE